MIERAELRVGGEVRVADLPQLIEDVRHARVPSEAELHYAPWTGEHWRRIQAIPELEDALDFPGARFHAHLLERRRPWLTALLVAALLAGGAAQMSLGSWPPDEAAALLSRLAVGWEPTVVRGGWWTAISSQLVHANVLHLLGNLAVISYCAFRCERAVGSAGLLAFVAASTTGGAAMVCALGDRPCVGSSILGFGLWGAQFALGWRFEEWIPERLRGNYGVGTAFITIPLWIESLTSPSVSFAGHLGGWLGGATAAMLLAPPTATPKAAVAAATRRALLVAAGLFALPMLAVVWGRS